MELSTYFSVSTRMNTGSSSAADHCREGSHVKLPRKVARRRCVIEKISCTQRSSSWSRWITRPFKSIPTVSELYPGQCRRQGWITNLFVTKRRICHHQRRRISWTPQWKPRSAVTWKYPSCILRVNKQRGESFGALTNKLPGQADTAPR